MSHEFLYTVLIHSDNITACPHTCNWHDALFCLEMSYYSQYRTTVNVEIFTQYIFSRISRRDLDARKYDMSEKLSHYRSNRLNCYMPEN